LRKSSFSFFASSLFKLKSYSYKLHSYQDELWIGGRPTLDKKRRF